MSAFSSPAELQRIRRRQAGDKVFVAIMVVAVFLALAALVSVLYQIISAGTKYFGPNLFNNFPSFRADQSGVKHAFFGSLYLMVLTLLFSVPIGVMAAIYLNEFQSRQTRFSRFIELNIANLSGVPSIVYGMLGLAVFVPFAAQIARDPMAGKSLLTGALTMSLLVLPLVIMVSQEALKTVPNTHRFAALAMGATPVQMVRKVVLPEALPGILTGIILAASRAIGETAPLIVVGAVVMSNFVPDGPFDKYGVLPLQVFDWAARPQPEFKDLAASVILLLMAMLILLNSFAIYFRAKARR